MYKKLVKYSRFKCTFSGVSPTVNAQQLRNPSSSTGPDSPEYSEPTDRNGNNVDQRDGIYLILCSKTLSVDCFILEN